MGSCDAAIILQGYTAHVINTGAEWVVAGLMVIFFLTYFTDFRSFTVTIAITLKDNHPITEHNGVNNCS